MELPESSVFCLLSSVYCLLLFHRRPAPRQVVPDGEVIQRKVGEPDRFEQEIGVEWAPRVAALPRRFHTHQRERCVQTANNREESSTLVRRPVRECLRGEVTLQRRMPVGPF